MNDLISRQAAIDLIMETDPFWAEGMTRAIFDGIEQLPPAQPDLDEWCVDCKEYDSEKHCCPRFNHVIRKAMERKKGQWLFPYGDKKYKRCSECGKVFYSIPHNTKYCPNCGADMKEGNQ